MANPICTSIHVFCQKELAQIGLKGKSFGPQEKKNFQIQAIDHL